MTVKSYDEMTPDQQMAFRMGAMASRLEIGRTKTGSVWHLVYPLWHTATKSYCGRWLAGRFPFPSRWPLSEWLCMRCEHSAELRGLGPEVDWDA